MVFQWNAKSLTDIRELGRNNPPYFTGERDGTQKAKSRHRHICVPAAVIQDPLVERCMVGGDETCAIQHPHSAAPGCAEVRRVSDVFGLDAVKFSELEAASRRS